MLRLLLDFGPRNRSRRDDDAVARYIPSPGSILQKLDRARNTKTPESYVFLITEVDSSASIGELLSITVGHFLPGEGIGGYNALNVLKLT
jgi:hypothetical protein